MRSIAEPPPASIACHSAEAIDRTGVKKAEILRLSRDSNLQLLWGLPKWQAFPG